MGTCWSCSKQPERIMNCTFIIAEPKELDDETFHLPLAFLEVKEDVK